MENPIQRIEPKKLEVEILKTTGIDLTYDEVVKIPPKKKYSVEINIIQTRKGVLKVIEDEKEIFLNSPNET